MFVLSSIQYIRNNDLLFIFKRPFALSNYESTIKLYFNTDRLINPFHETTNYFPHYLKFHYYYYYIYHLTIDNEKRKYHPRKNTQLFFDHSLKKKKRKKNPPENREFREKSSITNLSSGRLFNTTWPDYANREETPWCNETDTGRAMSIIYPRLRTDLQGSGMICGVNTRAGTGSVMGARGEGWKEGWHTMEMRACDVSLSSHVFIVIATRRSVLLLVHRSRGSAIRLRSTASEFVQGFLQRAYRSSVLRSFAFPISPSFLEIFLYFYIFFRESYLSKKFVL